MTPEIVNQYAVEFKLTTVVARGRVAEIFPPNELNQFIEPEGLNR